ncbi:MAG: PAS domain-containing protein [Nitrospiraceae bacterium]|nr:PAS domain-containing protein [Nitrospiraceae bacterium]
MTFISILVLSAAAFVLVFAVKRLISYRNELRAFLTELSEGNSSARLPASFDEETMMKALKICRDMEKAQMHLVSADTQRRTLDAMLRSLSDGIVVVSSAGLITLANRTFVRVLSLERRIEGRLMNETVRHLKLNQIFSEAMESRDVVTEEIEVEHSGRIRYFIATAVPVVAAETDSVIITLHDITRLKQLEMMRRDFIANVSHEIKTPLTAIRGFSETLIDGAINDTESAIRFLQMIKNHSERLNNLVGDLLTLSSIETGDINIDRSDADLDQVIDSVFLMLQDKASGKGLYLKKEIPTGLGRITADRDKLIQVALNLVDNGIKFTENGGITAGVSVEAGSRVFFVKDTGAGIPKEHLDRLGERFYRVDKARSRALGGTGLGLAIVKHILIAHGWSMAVESEPGKGTTIKIFLDKQASEV